MALTPLALLWPKQSWNTNTFVSGQETLRLFTGTKGPLLLRRWPWLKCVIAGKMHWLGPLPRSNQQLKILPEDLAHRIAENLPGLFSWADTQGCYEPDQEDEWIHAAFQLLHDDGSVNRLLLRKALALAFTIPPSNS